MKVKHIYIAILALFVASCSSNEMDSDNSGTLSGDGNKTPLVINACIKGGTTVSRGTDGTLLSRAEDGSFGSEESLFIYLRHVTGTAGSYTSIVADQAPRFVTLTTKAEGSPVESFDVTYTATDNNVRTALYWDDFSESGNDGSNDLRSSGHGLQAFYALGNVTESEITDKTKGLLETVEGKDIIYCSEQQAVTYAHDTLNAGGKHGDIQLPFTHAMSKITINVIVGDGFDNTVLTNTATTINNVYKDAKFTASTGSFTYMVPGNISLSAKDIQTNEDNKSVKPFSGYVVPGTNLTVGNSLATITDVAGNNYNIPVTKGIIDTWSEKLKESTEELENGNAQAKDGTFSRASEGIDKAQGYELKPGVHYVLNITVSKTRITLSATIQDWDAVYANAAGQIVFANDVTETGTIAEALQTSGFDVYKNTSNSDFTAKCTTLTYADGNWKYTPSIYWKDQNDKEYFRALSPAGTTSTALVQGIDYLWGTSGNEAISPRTGDVNLDFQHAMSKITMKLETNSNDAAKVDLTGAKIEISNLVTTGSIDVATGVVTSGSAVTLNAVSQQTAPISELAVIPQTISDNAVVKITLADGTIYTLKLNNCLDSETNAAVTEWQQGKHYTYTILIEKESATFRALIKNWEEKTGSGNANLEWD